MSLPPRSYRVRWGVLLSTAADGEVILRTTLEDASRFAGATEREFPGVWAWIMRRDDVTGVWINPGTGYTPREVLADFKISRREEAAAR